MKLARYLKDQRLLLLFQAVGIFALSFYLRALNIPLWQILFLSGLGVLLLLAYFTIDYLRRHRYQKKMGRLIHHLEDCYLITELLPRPKDAQGEFYYEILSMCCRAMSNRVQDAVVGQREYQEYIEALVHEVKNPVAAMQMMVANHPSSISDPLLDELLSIDYSIEQALFYAKSETLSQDYQVKPVLLEDAVRQVLRSNARLLILHKISVEPSQLDVTVSSDEKWLEFILSQLVVNAAKYAKSADCRRLSIHAKPYDGGIRLDVWDNGMGIPADELSRVFDKGFVGTTGRRNGKSTGLGLYIAKKLCHGLGHDLTLISREGEFTCATLWFPKQKLLG